MTNYFAWGAAFLAEQMWLHASSPIVYVRGTLAVPMRAVLGNRLLQINDTHGQTRIERTDRDYIIRAADMAAFGQPLRGDLVRETHGTMLQTYEVMAYGDEPPAAYSDITTYLTWRVHAKLLTTETI